MDVLLLWQKKYKIEYFGFDFGHDIDNEPKSYHVTQTIVRDCLNSTIKPNDCIYQDCTISPPNCILKENFLKFDTDETGDELNEK